MCTTREWQDLFNGTKRIYDTLEAVKLLTDVMISLCAVAKTQEKSIQPNSILALKYYITPFASIMTVIYYISINRTYSSCLITAR